MIRPVIGTIGARVLITVANLLMVALAGRALGAEGLGGISLIILGVTLVLILAHVVGGGGLVYLVPRFGVGPLLLPAYAWAIVTALMALSVVGRVPIAPEGFALHVVGLAFLQALNSIHLNILVAQERIGLQNTLLVSQSLVQLTAFAFLLELDGPSLMDHVHASYLAYGLVVVLSFWSVARTTSGGIAHQPGKHLRVLMVQGGIGQLANLFQLFNYRAAYYLIEAFRGTAALGVYSVATQLAEGTWLVPKSIGGVLYSRISNLEAQRRQLQLTAILFKVAVVFGLCCSVVLITVPDAWYGLLFGKEVRGLGPLLLLLAPGLVAMSGSQVLSHYLSGTGRIRHNMIGSGLGLVVTLLVGWPAISSHGLTGSAFTASLAYGTSMVYQTVVFLRITGSPLSLLLPQADDLRRVRWLGHLYRAKRRNGGSYL